MFSLKIAGQIEVVKENVFEGKKTVKVQMVHISEYSDSNVGVQPDTFAMRFSSL